MRDVEVHAELVADEWLSREPDAEHDLVRPSAHVPRQEMAQDAPRDHERAAMLLEHEPAGPRALVARQASVEPIDGRPGRREIDRPQIDDLTVERRPGRGYGAVCSH